METRDVSSMLDRLTGSPFLRVFLLGFLVLLLQIPVVMVMEVIHERERTRNEAVIEVTSKWGGKQIVGGPLLVIPYHFLTVETGKDGKEIVNTETRYATFLPETLNMKGGMQSEVRNRGIYDVILYVMKMDFEGSFVRPDFTGWDISSENILWDRARLAVMISDVQGISEQAQLTWGDAKIEFEPGSGENSQARPGIHAALNLSPTSATLNFKFTLSLKGSSGASFVPLGKQTRIEVDSNWQAPSFSGNWLPLERTFGPEGFTARWETTYLARNFAQRFLGMGSWDEAISQSAVGVDLLNPVDQYRMALRSVKYAALFFCLTYAVFWLFEVLGGLRIHPVQYSLVGAAMCLFYLLEISLSEHIGFGLAYVIASIAVVCAISLYCFSALQCRKRAALVAAVLIVLYSYLYTVLENADFALLAGSLGLFFALCMVMYLTRNVDWRRAGRTD